jgi:hypothetical protein
MLASIVRTIERSRGYLQKCKARSEVTVSEKQIQQLWANERSCSRTDVCQPSCHAALESVSIDEADAEKTSPSSRIKRNQVAPLNTGISLRRLLLHDSRPRRALEREETVNKH